VLSVSNSAAASTTGLVIKNTAATGVARLQLDANTATGFAQLEVAPTGNCTLNVPGQEIWLQNRLTGQAPLIVETNGIVTTAYGQNDLSDEKVKQNVRDAEAIFDRAAPKRYDQADLTAVRWGVCKRLQRRWRSRDLRQRPDPGKMAEEAALDLLRRLASDFNVRDARKLYQIAKREFPDQPAVTVNRARDALRGDVARQPGQERGRGPNDRLQADLIGLVVTDVFTREAVTRALPNKNAETVARAAAEAIPNYVVTTDEGNEFRTLEANLPQGVVHRQKRPEDRNATAVVDRTIQTLKKDLAGEVARRGGKWDDHAAEATEAYNARGRARRARGRGDAARHQDNAEKFQHNKQLTEGRQARLQQAGAFRAPII
ncbi:unnamed protein product, partial [Symbiodinium pilosum]